MKNVDVIIPVYNEEGSIGLVIGDIPKEIVNEVVVVNNLSTDNSVEVAKQAGATVVDQDKRGYGNACLKGIEYVDAKAVKPYILVFLDGDYSDHPEELPALLKPIIEDDYDLVIGSRTTGSQEKGAMLPQAVFGNFLATSLIRLFYGFTFTDLGPFRVIKYESLKSLEMQDTTFGWTVEMQVKALKKGLKCTEVPVSYRKRIGVSKITGTLTGTVKAGYKIIWTIFKYL
ncbi:MAG: glycosyltransferase family 2 protein [Thermodesulfobacteriota bacterium]